MNQNPVKIRPIDSSISAQHMVNQPHKGIAVGQRVSKEMAAKSSLKLVPDSGERAKTEDRGAGFEPAKMRRRLTDAGFFLLALGVAAAMWWSVTVN